MNSLKPMTLEKDYLNVKEAAVYMGLSLSGFKGLANAQNIPFGKVPRGNKIYRRTDLALLNILMRPRSILKEKKFHEYR